MAKFLVSHPCDDGCGEIETGDTCQGAPVYRCPGCDTEWIEDHEITEPDAPFVRVPRQ
ncbi:hypothetical protein GCM10027418_31290 [Mariniluteicoccus endophyticus]